MHTDFRLGNQQMTLLESGHLLQQFVVDMYVKIETSSFSVTKLELHMEFLKRALGPVLFS